MMKKSAGTVTNSRWVGNLALEANPGTIEKVGGGLICTEREKETAKDD